VLFLADESCDFAVVRALRDAGHDVFAVAQISPAAVDSAVLALARAEARILLTEDKDFGTLAYAGGQETAGVILIRFPADARSELGQTLVSVIAGIGERFGGAFVVVEPGRVRVSRPPERS
jgi:predicted nuclease of predicted toxin-antitoxin system